MKSKLTRIVFLSFVSLWVAFFLFSNKIQAAASTNFSGWFWGGSDDGAGNNSGLGWISTSNVNCDANNDNVSNGAPAGCPAVGTAIGSYNINMPGSDGKLSGYAWSENFGWISFNEADTAGCPPPSDATYGCSAFRSGNNIKGWARITALCDSASDGKCLSGETNTNSGGWNGWVHLSGTNYGIQINNDGSITKGQNTSYAWSDELGFIDFSGASLKSFALTVATAGGGSTTVTSAPSGINCLNGSGTCSATFNSGSSVTLTAVAASGSTFQNWTGCATTSGNTCTVSMDAAKTVTANSTINCDPSACINNLPNMCPTESCVGCGITYTGTKDCSVNVGDWVEVAP